MPIQGRRKKEERRRERRKEKGERRKRGVTMAEGLMPFLGPLRCMLGRIPGTPQSPEQLPFRAGDNVR
jgi:hypothetical protein